MVDDDDDDDDDEDEEPRANGEQRSRMDLHTVLDSEATAPLVSGERLTT